MSRQRCRLISIGMSISPFRWRPSARLAAPLHALPLIAAAE